MNAGLIRRDAQNESDGAGAAQLRRSSDSVAAAALSPQHYNLASNVRPIVACLPEVLLACWQHLEERRGGASRRDASCAQHEIRRSSISSVAAAGDGSVPRR